MLTPVVVKEELEGNGLGGWIFSGSKHFAPSEEPPVLLGKVDSPAVLRISQLRDRLPLNRPTVGVFTGPRLQSCQGAGQGNHRRGGWGCFHWGVVFTSASHGALSLLENGRCGEELGPGRVAAGSTFSLEHPWVRRSLRLAGGQGDAGEALCPQHIAGGTQTPAKKQGASLFSSPSPPFFL